MNIRYYIYIFFSIAIYDAHAIFRTNVLQPYNIFLQPDPRNETRFSFQLGYEGICSAQAFTPRVDGTNNVLQIFQCNQDAIAAFKGFAPETEAGQYAQIFDINDDNTSHGIFTPNAKLTIPLNGLLGLQVKLAHNVSLHGYVPFLYAELSDICWTEKNNHTEFENNNFPQLLSTVGQVGCIDLYNGWKRLGFGDTVVFVKWQNDFWQMKPVLRNVRLSLRGGLNFPTGKKEDISKLLALPFGYDQGYGVYFAGNLNLFMNYDWRFMLDLEFLQLFGNTQTRRIKTDVAQTDLLLIAKDRVYVDPGFTQQYTFMLEKRSIYQGLSAALYYQYFKHNDDTYYPVTNYGNFQIINDAESVQEYTTHQFIFKLNYEFNQFETSGSRPNLMLFGKYGFNGKRAILTSSVGLQFTYAY
jgi:hypothetical protein